MVYNNNEIKMSMTKERIVVIRHDVDYAVFVFFGLTALSDYREKVIVKMELSISHSLSILFK